MKKGISSLILDFFSHHLNLRSRQMYIIIIQGKKSLILTEFNQSIQLINSFMNQDLIK